MFITNWYLFWCYRGTYNERTPISSTLVKMFFFGGFCMGYLTLLWDIYNAWSMAECPLGQTPLLYSLFTMSGNISIATLAYLVKLSKGSEVSPSLEYLFTHYNPILGRTVSLVEADNYRLTLAAILYLAVDIG